MKTSTITCVPYLLMCSSTLFSCCSISLADSFGNGLNRFEIEFVTIGQPGNVDDTTGNPNPVGSVDYAYRIGKFEISQAIVDKANAQSAADGKPLGLVTTGRAPEKPATDLSWYEAARFVNWLNTSTGSAPAYNFDGNGEFQLWQPGDAGYNPSNLFRNREARYFLPSTDEWYKAAYYDPNQGVYYNYPTGSDTPPSAILTGTSQGTAIYNQPAGRQPADVTSAGGLSPYGTTGQGGNVIEWEESSFDRTNSSPSLVRASRGGYWLGDLNGLSATARSMSIPTGKNDDRGFRVASIPEPGSLALLTLASTLSLLQRQINAPSRRAGDRDARREAWPLH